MISTTVMDMKAIEEGEVVTASPRADTFPVNASRSKGWYVSFSIAFAAVLVLSLGLGLGLSRDENKSNEVKNELLQNNNAKNTSTSTNDGSNDFPVKTNPISFASRLTTISDENIQLAYDSCDSLKDDLSILAQLIANGTIESNDWYFDQPIEVSDNVTVGGIMDIGTAEFIVAPEESARKSVLDSNFGTNNQVRGVEEGDLVQSNGEQVFVVYGSEVIVLAADAVSITSRTKIPSKSDDCGFGYIASIMLVDDRLVVVATSYCSEVMASDSNGTSDIMTSGQDTSDVHIYDTSDMSLIETLNLNGTFISARAIEGNVHIVTLKYIDFYGLTQYLEPWRDDIYGVNVTKAQYHVKAQEQVKEHQQEFVDKILQGLDCTSVKKLALFQNSDDVLTPFSSLLDSITTVTSFSTKSDSVSTSTTSMMLPSGGFSVYASAKYLILAVQGWWVNEATMEQTYLISYKLEGPSSNATSLGIVPGYILNQFSIDHAVQDGENYLRVASTSTAVTQRAQEDGVWIENANATSRVTVLKMDDEASSMLVVGTIVDLGGNGEAINSVLFMGDRGFVTTFDTTAPFYTLDLSDPSNPVKAGELAISGYSSYLHPVGNDLIIGVGQATDSNGTALGVQISLFDISSFSNPVRIQTFSEVGNSSSASSSSFSEAEYDFKAFRYLNESQLLVIPITIYNYSPCNYTFENPAVNDTMMSPISFGNSSEASVGEPLYLNETMTISPSVETSFGGSEGEPMDSTNMIDPFPGPCYESTYGYDGFRVYEVTTNGIQPYLSIEHEIADMTESCWSGAFLPTRSLVFDGDLMTMKTHTILSHDLSTLTSDATPINLDDNNTVC